MYKFTKSLYLAGGRFSLIDLHGKFLSSCSSSKNSAELNHSLPTETVESLCYPFEDLNQLRYPIFQQGLDSTGVQEKLKKSVQYQFVKKEYVDLLQLLNL